MGRKDRGGEKEKEKARRRRDKDPEEEEEEKEDQVEEESVTEVSQEDPPPPDERFHEALELLGDKKSASRLNGLQQILKLLQCGGVEIFPQDSAESLRSHLTRFLRHPTSSSEGILACKVLSVLSLIFGQDDDFYNSYFPLLKNVITRVEDEQSRIEGLRTLAFLSYVSSTERADSPAWTLCEELLLLTSEGLDATIDLRWCALRSWCLLAGVIQRDLVLEHSRDGLFGSAVAILEDADTDGKIAAGECLAFLWEVAADYLPEGSSQEWQSALCEDPREFDRALELAQQISRDSSKRIAKKEKKERKGTMRMVLDWINEGIAPEEVLELRGADVDLASFGLIQFVDTLKYVLGDGFQNCLQSFPYSRELLGVEFMSQEYFDTENDVDVKMRHAYNERQRTGYRRQDRKDKQQSESYVEESW